MKLILVGSGRNPQSVLENFILGYSKAHVIANLWKHTVYIKAS